MTATLSSLGIVIVTYNAANVILRCLESLLAAPSAGDLHIAVVDNNSTDGTVALIKKWAAGQGSTDGIGDAPFPLNSVPKPIALHNPEELGPGITLIETGLNRGFASGVNRGLAHLAQHADINRFWILNPDCIVPPETPDLLARYTPTDSDGSFALLGHRILYLDPPERIQSDGARVNRLTGVTGNLHLGQDAQTTSAPDLGDIDFISGASMVASREFYEKAGPLPEDYFLYYEEVDWALQRDDLPLAYCPDAVVYHEAGTSIGSPTVARIASPFSIYFMYRARLKFILKYNPLAFPVAYGYALAKAVQIALKGHFSEAKALLYAINGLKPPASVRKKLPPETLKAIFG